MASLSSDDVLKLASLARLQLTDDEVARYQRELTAILDYVTQLDAVDTTGLEPTSQVTGLTNVSRPDEIIDYGYKAAKLLENVPELEGDLLKVKRMIA